MSNELTGNSGGLKVEFEIHEGEIPVGPGFMDDAYYLLIWNDLWSTLKVSARAEKLHMSLTSEGFVIVFSEGHMRDQPLSDHIHYTHWALVPHWTKIIGVKTYADEMREREEGKR